MNILDNILQNITYVLFPLTLYLIYFAYIKNMDLEEKSIFLEIALFSSLYMLFRNIDLKNYAYAIVFLNIPLLIAYLKRKTKTAVLISITLIIFIYTNLNISLILLIIEYVLYFIIYSGLMKKNELNIRSITTIFVSIRTFFIAFQSTFYLFFDTNPYHLLLNISTMVIFLVATAYIILLLFEKCEGVMNYNSTLNELNREKEIRTSLFKITHEIKNPLAVLLMDDFLDYTKVKINKEDVDLILLLEEISLELKPLFKKNNIKTKLNIPDDEIYLDLDYNRMKQVLVNIFKNSVEAKSDDTTITVDINEHKDMVDIIISDTGVGMSNEVLEKIGQNFYTTKERGTGLGVSLSKEIIALHGGKIRYESTLGKGTKVYISLPAN